MILEMHIVQQVMFGKVGLDLFDRRLSRQDLLGQIQEGNDWKFVNALLLFKHALKNALIPVVTIVGESLVFVAFMFLVVKPLLARHLPRWYERAAEQTTLMQYKVQERKENNQSDFLPHHLQRVLVISCVFRNAEGLRVHSFVDRDNASEGKVIQNFFNAVDKHVPQLVSWNGR